MTTLFSKKTNRIPLQSQVHQEPVKQNSIKRNSWLDIVRATAILLVVNCHIASSQAAATEGSRFIDLLGLGGHGVDLFFVLSGWLLGRLLFTESKKTGTVRVRRFLNRRWLRTLPAYYAVLSLTLLQAAVQGRFETKQLSYFCFAQGYVYDAQPFFGVSWSLCVEEHFYLLIAPLILVIGHRRRAGALLLCLLLILPIAFRLMGLYSSLNQTHVRVDQCAAGVALAYLCVYFPTAWERFQRILPIFGLLALTVLTVVVAQRVNLLPGPTPLIAFTFLSVILVAYAEHGDWWRERANVPGAHYLATRSYSLYLLHVEAIALCDRLGISSFLIRVVVVWSVGLFLSEFLYRLIELPFMKLRDHPFFTRASRETSVDSG